MQKGGTMDVNLHLTGELEAFINSLIKRGMAANKTEAIRLSIIRYKDLELEQKKFQMGINEGMNQHTIEAAWNNPKDEVASGFYKRKYLHGKKA
jgi:Arc/MetJ-type ribon-helix-helix transcriptional regulator